MERGLISWTHSDWLKLMGLALDGLMQKDGIDLAKVRIRKGRKWVTINDFVAERGFRLQRAFMLRNSDELRLQISSKNIKLSGMIFIRGRGTSWDYKE